MFSSQEIGTGLVSFKMIFEALQFKLFRFNFYSLSSKILKIPAFSLFIYDKKTYYFQVEIFSEMYRKVAYEII